MLTVGTSVVALSAVTAGPALAHYCYKDGWNEKAHAGASKSQAWFGPEVWYGILEEVVAEGFICQDGADVIAATLAANGDDALYMGPGLLAGGAVRQGKQLPSGISHLPIGEAFAACGTVDDHH